MPWDGPTEDSGDGSASDDEADGEVTSSLVKLPGDLYFLPP